LFPHLEAFFQLSEVNVHKIFTVSSFRGIPPLTTEAFNPPDSFAKGPSLVSSLKSIFAGFATKRSQNIYIFNLPQQRNVALLLFVKGKKTQKQVGAF
jgi:hypothetical protein